MEKFRSFIKSSTKEDLLVLLLGASFFIGVWYALPMVNTVCDTWAYGGGVLRAMEAHTIFPGGDVPYGTISFYQNYVLWVIPLGFGLLFTGFNIEVLKTFFVLNPSYTLLVPRVASVLSALLLLLVVYRFLKTNVQSLWWRTALLMALFGNVLTALLVRSGKMWILATTFGVISFIYLHRALTEEREKGVPGKLSAISIVFAFLAAANFPFFALFLINIPIIFCSFPRTAKSLQHLSTIVFSGSMLFLGIVALNAHNTIGLVGGSLTHILNSPVGNVASDQSTVTFFEAFMVNVRQAVESFPLLLLALFSALYAKMRDRKLAYLSLVYIIVYITTASILFRSNYGLDLNIRHIFPLGFFLIFLVAAYCAPAKRVAVGFFSVGLILYVYSMMLFSVPTTYNDASNFINAQYRDKEIRIDENIFELTLPTNKASYLLYKDSSCGSTCKYRREITTDIQFRPIVITNDMTLSVLGTLPPTDIIVVERAIAGCTPLARFGNPVPDDEIFDMDINLGRMVMPSFYKIHQLGKNIYIYDAKVCSMTSALRKTK